MEIHAMSCKFEITQEFFKDAPQSYIDAFLDLIGEVDIKNQEFLEDKDTHKIEIEDEELPDVDELKICFHSEGKGDVTALFRVPDE